MSRSVRSRASGLLVAPVAVLLLGSSALAGSAVPSDTTHGTLGAYVHPGLDWRTRARPATTSRARQARSSIGSWSQPPQAYWPSGAGSAQGKVGWQVVIQKEQQPATTFAPVKTSRTLRASASKIASASFSARTVHFKPGAHGIYRLVDRLVWYKPNGHPMGSVKHTISFYRYSGAVSTIQQYPCEDPLI